MKQKNLNLYLYFLLLGGFLSGGLCPGGFRPRPTDQILSYTDKHYQTLTNMITYWNLLHTDKHYETLTNMIKLWYTLSHTDKLLHTDKHY
jgi:hypothetical protein